MPTIKLKPIKESTRDYEEIERRIKRLLKEEIFLPLVHALELPKKTLNAGESSALQDALRTGRVTFYRGKVTGSFSGRFNSEITKELRKIGAKFDRVDGTYHIRLSLLPPEIAQAARASDYYFARKMAVIDRKLAELSPAKIAENLKTADCFDRVLWKTERDFQASVRNITVAPKLTEYQAKRISEEWQENLQLWITDFTEKQITDLRKDMKTAVFSGNRYENLTEEIAGRYEVTANKAKFLARQETSLLMTKHRQSRYQEAGIDEYEWCCVKGSPAHPVRPMHKVLDGKTFNWNTPPIVNEKGERKNPGQDYNCRCFAKPIVRF